MASHDQRNRTIIMGAAGRDFHVFNLVFREDPKARVVAFTATQIPNIAGRRYPASLAGPLYPEGVPIVAECELERLIRDESATQVVFAYSDVAHAEVMHASSRALAAGADFVLFGPHRTMLPARRPVIAISAVRTGCGKSQTARWLASRLRDRGARTAVLRHPMPYGDLARERVQRFASLNDIKAANCTAEEREEYEPHVAAGNVVFAGVDYAAILSAAENEADIIVWDGGNNDFPFIKPDLHIAIADAMRPDQIDTHHPGEAVARMADVVVINKVDSATADAIATAEAAVRRVNPRATVVRAASPVEVADPAAVAGKRVLVVEDGPTTTHGGMAYGAGMIAAKAARAGEIIDPRRSATPEIQAVYATYPHIGRVLPAVGYSAAQLDALRRTIESSDAEVVVSGTPLDLAALVTVGKPIVRACYRYAEVGSPRLSEIVDDFLARPLTRPKIAP
ncbi:MAG: cyclic 2,3-diphosphoglycerate synthase [Alphaproteobacteria bacterium]